MGFTRHVINYVGSCQTCSQTKRSNLIFKAPLTLRDLSPHPWAAVNIDWVSCLPVTRNGNKNMMVITDYYSKYVIAWPMKFFQASSVARDIFDRLICVHGCPLSITSDNGAAFISDMFKEMCRMFGVTQKFSSSYHVKTSGAVERANRSLLTVLRNYTSTRQDNWDEFLPSARFSLNNSVAYATGHTPYFLLHGRQPRNPTELEMPDLEPTQRKVHEHLENILSRQDMAEITAREHEEQIRQKMKDRYDQSAVETKLVPGDIVYHWVPHLRLANTEAKLAAKYHGPYVIVRFTTPSTVKLKQLLNGKILKKSVNMDRLKKVKMREDVTHWEPLPNETVGDDVIRDTSDQIEVDDLQVDDIIGHYNYF